MIPPFAKYKSSQWDTTVIPSFGAACIASAINSVLITGLPSSLKAIAPASFKAAKLQSTSLCNPFVIAADTYTWASASFALFKIYCTVSTLSTVGFVFGIASTLVTPPAAAALQPLIMSSFSVWPGSRKCTCISTKPGAAINPLASMVTSVSYSKLVPMSAITPSTKKMSPSQSIFVAGSHICAFLIKIFTIFYTLPLCTIFLYYSIKKIALQFFTDKC